MKIRLAFIIGISLIIGLSAAGAVKVLPNQYTAKGLLVVARSAEQPGKDFFTYEGSYAQQTSESYAGTFQAILQSPANLKFSGISTDVKRISRLIKTKKEGPQAISLSVKGTSADQVRNLWVKVADSAINIHEEIKPTADPLITIVKVVGSPVVIKTYPDWQTVMGAGFIFSVIISFSVITIIRYLKEGNDN